MNNYTNEKERRLYFDDLWVRLKRSWVLVLAITLVFGILVDLLGYMRSKNGIDLHIEQTAEELRAQLTQDELQDVESVLEYKRQIRSTQAYLDDSVLVNLDATSIPTEKLTFRMSAGTGAALRSCYDALTDRAFLQKLAGSISWEKEPAYLGELIVVDQVKAAESSLLPYLNWDGYVYISVYGKTEEQARQIADYVRDYLSTATLMESETCTLVSRTQTVTINTALLGEKDRLTGSLNTITSTCNTKQAELSRTQKDLLVKEMEAEGFPAEDVSGATTQAQSESILQPKYLALGLLFGLVLGVLVVLLRYLFSKNIRSEKDLRDLTGLDYIVRLGDDPQNAALLAIYLQVQCEKSGLHQMTLLAARDLLPKGQQAVQALMETLGQSGLETAFCTLDTQDPAMLKQILSSRCVVPVAEIDRTDCASVQQEMNMCRRDEIPVPAGIVM